MRQVALFLAFGLGACAAQAPIPQPTQIGWKKMDGSVATGTMVDQSSAICNQEAMPAGEAYGGAMRFIALDAAVKGCMARRGYLPIMSAPR